jgi:hypothetical protein
MQYVSRLIISSLLLLSGSSPLLADVQIDIDPAFQETPEWCWITAGQMVVTYYGVANINPAGNFQRRLVGSPQSASSHQLIPCDNGAVGRSVNET